MSLLVVVRSDARAEALLRWASCYTDGNFEELYVLDCRESEHETTSTWQSLEDEAFPNVSYRNILEELDSKERIEIHYLSVKSPDAYQTVMREQQTLKPKLLLLDRNQDQDSNFEVKYIERLLNDVHCAVMVVRLGATDGGNFKTLIPVGGGPHSRFALKLVSSAAHIQPTAFFVEPDADEVSLDVGYARLNKILNTAGVDVEEVKAKAVISENVSRAIASEVDEGGYGMLMLGAPDAGSLRRKLFGTIADKYLKDKEGTAVGVIRAAKPMRHRMRASVERFLHLSIPQLSREERIGLFSDVEDKSIWSFDFAALMLLATTIASFGLLADSGAVVIGAMLVAPLMTPLLGGGLALVQGNLPLWKRCQKSVLLGFFAALAVGVCAGMLAKLFGIYLTNELAARGNPTCLDLGIAFSSGLAASYCLARPKLSGALAGVAIAAALVPPIATTGICLILGEMEVVRGSALLFGTNVVAIVFGSALNFYAAGIRGRSGASGIWSRRVFIVVALGSIGLAVPLTSSLIGTLARNESILNVLNEGIKGSEKVLSVSKGGVDSEGKLIIDVLVEAPGMVSQATLAEIKRGLEEAYKGKYQGVVIRVETKVVQEL